MSPQDFAAKVRTKYPGVYDHLADDELTQKVVTKYPQYGGQVVPGVPRPPRLKDMISRDETDAGLAGVPGGSPSVPPASDTARNIALGGIGAGAALTYGPAVPAIARKVAPYALPALGSYAINKARELPVVGPVINKIPMAEMLPWLFQGKGEPKGGPEGPTPPGAQPTPPRLIEQMGGKPPESIMDSAAYTSGPGPVIQRGPIPGSAADLAETRSLQEQIRDAAAAEEGTFASQQKRDWFARNQPGSSKGELTGAPENTVKFTKTPGVSSPKPGTTVPGPDESMVPLLRKSLKDAMRKKSSSQ